MEMTQEWIDQFNKKCAELLEWKNKGMVNLELWVSTERQYGITTSDLKFHSDWNWIHEVLDKIEKENFSIEIYSLGYNNHSMVIYSAGAIVCQSGLVDVKKEAVIQAINQFIDWYNKQKEI